MGTSLFDYVIRRERVPGLRVAREKRSSRGTGEGVDDVNVCWVRNNVSDSLLMRKNFLLTCCRTSRLHKLVMERMQTK